MRKSHELNYDKHIFDKVELDQHIQIRLTRKHTHIYVCLVRALLGYTQRIIDVFHIDTVSIDWIFNYIWPSEMVYWTLTLVTNVILWGSDQMLIYTWTSLLGSIYSISYGSLYSVPSSKIGTKLTTRWITYIYFLETSVWRITHFTCKDLRIVPNETVFLFQNVSLLNKFIMNLIYFSNKVINFCAK